MEFHLHKKLLGEPKPLEVKMSVFRYRTKSVALRITEEEYEMIRKKMQLAGINTFSVYARKMLIDGLIVEVNDKAFDNVAMQISRIGNNINQVVRRINKDDLYDKKDGEVLRKKLDEVCQLLRSIRLARP